MTNTNVAPTNPSLLRAWWMNKKLRFDVAMSSIIMILNIEAIFYMRTHNIPYGYDKQDAYVFGLISHISGWGVFLRLLYDISPQLALFVGLNFGLPCLLWLVAVMIVPCLWSGVQAVRGWWKFVNQPERVIG
ncbi:unnamed protein product [Arabis nemorensis]|uniref:Uncharacterized protein n=1 Tax=Arabis nemorensis TaxID=586526 RepID=A0A565BG99_9BRAS|nr:unnamed protein product [Arabis nemorensis]